MSSTPTNTIATGGTDQFSDFHGNLSDVQDAIDDTEMCVEETREVVEDVRELLTVFKEVRQKAGSIESILNGLEDAANIAKKIGPISRPAAALEDVFGQLGNVMGAIKSNAQTVENAVEPVRTNLGTLKDRMIDAEELLNKASVEVGEFQSVVGEVDYAVDQMENFTGSPSTTIDDDVNVGGDEMRDRLNNVASPTNDLLSEIYDKYILVHSTIDPVKDLLDNIPSLNSINLVHDLNADLDKILDKIGILENPLNDLAAVLDEVEWALDAAQFVYDNVVAPVVDPIIEATGIQQLIDQVVDQLTALLPDGGILEDFLNIDTEIEVDIPGITTPNLSYNAAFSSLFDGLDDMFGGFNLSGITTNFDQFALGNLPVVAPSKGLPFDFAALGLSVPDITVQRGWNMQNDEDNTASISHQKSALVGMGGDDTLSVNLSNTTSEAVFGGAGNDLLNFGSSPPTSFGAYDVMVGGEGDDAIHAQSYVLVQYNSFISDYVFTKNLDYGTQSAAVDGVNDYGILEIEHLNITDSLDEGRDLVVFNEDTLLAFDGYTIDALTFVNGLQNLPADALPLPSEADTLRGRTDTDDPGLVGHPTYTGPTGYVDNGTNPGASIEDFLFGAVGDIDERFFGYGNDDLLVGRGGDDLLNGGAGDDYFDGGTGNDTIIGGLGFDVVDFRSEGQAIDIFLGVLDEDDEARGIERVIGTDFADVIFGDRSGPNELWGGAGNDLLRSSGGQSNLLRGQEGKDVLVLDTGNDTAKGGGNNDVFFVSLDPTNNQGINTIIGGDNAGDNVDVVSYGRSSVTTQFSDVTFFSDTFLDPELFDTPALHGADLDIVAHNALGYVEIRATPATVGRLDSSDDTLIGLDNLFGIERIVGSEQADIIKLQGDAYVDIIHGNKGNDTFTSKQILRENTGQGILDDRPELFGGSGGDLFELKDIYKITGNGGTDTLDMSTSRGLHWYIDARDDAVGMLAYTLDVPALDISGNVDNSIAVLPETNNLGAPSGAAASIGGVEEIIGGDLRDIIVGDNSVELIEGRGGDDLLIVKNDTSKDDTTVLGGEGDDTIVGGWRADLLKGEEGNDTIDLTFGTANSTTDVAEGGVGNDRFFVTDIHSNAFLTIYGGSNDGSGGLTDDTYDVFDENNVLIETNTFIDTIDFFRSVAGDGISGTGNLAAATVDLANNANNAGAAENHTYYGIEAVLGSKFDDSLKGNSGPNTLLGRQGRDLLEGGNGKDILIGGRDADELRGNAGNDTIWGGSQPDANSDAGVGGGHYEEIHGGGGIDTLTFQFARAAAGLEGEETVPKDGTIGSVYVDLQDNLGQAAFTGSAVFTSDADSLQIASLLNGIENVIGGALNDTILGDAGANILQGGEGADDINGRDGNDTVDGGKGDDTVHGGGDDDTVIGSQGTDAYNGGLGIDTLDIGGAASGATFDFAAGTVRAGYADVANTWADNDGTEGRPGSYDTETFTNIRPFDVYRTINPTLAKRAEHIDANYILAVSDGEGNPLSGFEILTEDEIDVSTSTFTGFEKYVGSTHDDIFKFVGGGSFNLDGGEGSDLLSFDFASTVDLTVNLSTTAIQTVATGLGAPADLNLQLANIEDIDANAGADNLDGNASNNTIWGRSGIDSIDGNAGDDTLFGGSQDDTLEGGLGNDLIDGGSGSDQAIYRSDMHFNGQSNYRIAEFANGDVVVSDRVTTIGGDEGTDLLTSVGEFVFSGAQVNFVAKSNLQKMDVVAEWNKVGLTDAWSTISLNHTFNNPVVIAGISTYNDNDYVQVQIQNVTATGFDIRLEETSDLDGIHPGETVTYFVVESGRHVLDDGTVIEAGTVGGVNAVVQSTLQEQPEIVAYSGAIQNARVFTNTNTDNGGDWQATRAFDATSTGFKFALIEEEADDTGHGTSETVGWVAVQAGARFDFETEIVNADENPVAATITPDIAGFQTINALDPAVPRIDGQDVFTTEDRTLDFETSRGNDNIAVIDFKGDFGFLFVPNLEAFDDTATTDEDTLISIDVLANDVDPDTGGTKAIDQILGVTGGSAVINNDKIDFTPTLNSSGNATVTYRMTDSRGEFSVAQVAITVKAVNDAPVFTSGITYNTTDALATVGLVQATDVESGTNLDYSLEGGADAALFDVDQTTGEITFTSGLNVAGTYTIDVGANDGTDLSTQAVTINVADVTDPALSALDLANGSDSGASNSDDLTNDATPTIRFTTEAGATVEIDWGDGNGFQAASNGTGSQQLETLGVTMGNPYDSDGVKTITVRSTDAAGNLTEKTLNITIDTIDPLFSLNISNKDNVDDASDTNLKLDGAFGAASAEVGGNNYLFVAGKDDDGISVFSVANDGTLTNVDNVSDADNTANELLGARALATADVGGVTYLFAAAREDNGISVFSVDANGQLTVVDNVDDADDPSYELNQVGDLAIAVVGGNTYLFGASQADSGVAAFRVDPGGLLTSVDQESDTSTLELNGARSVATVRAGGNEFLIATGNVDDGVSVFSIAADGTLTNTDNIDNGDDADTILNGAYDVATAQVQGTTYVIVASQVGNGISVFSLTGTGALNTVFNLPDNGILKLDDARALSTAQIGNSTYLFAGGTADDGVSIFKIKANGTLEFKGNLEDDATLELDGVQGLHVAEVNGKSFLVGAGSVDDGVSTFNVPSAVDLRSTSDTGTFNGDDITSDTTPIIQYIVEAGSTVTVDWGNGVGFQSVADGTGGLQQQILSTAYSNDGTKTILVRAVDDAGNQITESIDVTIDTQAVLSTIDLTNASDTGSSSTDDFTADDIPTIEFTAEDGSTVLVDWDDGNGFVPAGNGAGVPQQETIAAPYSSDGAKAIQVQMTDLAGNTTTNTLNITLDTQAPALSAIDLTDASDEGPSNTDDITGDITPTIEFTAEAGATVDIDWGDGNGFVPAAGNGTGAAQQETLAAAYIANGAKAIQVRATDVAGNVDTQALNVDIVGIGPDNFVGRGRRQSVLRLYRRRRVPSEPR